MPHLLLVHHNAHIRDRLATSLRRQPEVDVVEAGSVEEARARLVVTDDEFDAVVLWWALPDQGALRLMCIIAGLELIPLPRILAFNSAWQQADLKRAFQLGVEGFFTDPLKARAVMTELQIISQYERGVTRSELLRASTERLLQHDPMLWTVEPDPAWGRRMASRARVNLAELQRGHEARMARLDAEVRDALPPDVPLTPPMLQAVAASARRGEEAQQALARLYGVDYTTLNWVMTALEADQTDEMAAKVERPERLWALDALARDLFEVQDARHSATTLETLRSRAKTMLSEAEMGGIVGPRMVQDLVSALAEHLRMPSEELGALDSERVEYISRALAHSVDEESMRRVRLVLLAHLLRDLPSEGHAVMISDTRLDALASALGARVGHERDELDAIKAVLSEVDPGLPEPLPALRELARLVAGLDERRMVVGVNVPQLITNMRALANADAPGGELDRMRVNAAEKLFEKLFSARVGLRTLEAIAGAFTTSGPDHSPMGLPVAALERLLNRVEPAASGLGTDDALRAASRLADLSQASEAPHLLEVCQLSGGPRPFNMQEDGGIPPPRSVGHVAHQGQPAAPVEEPAPPRRWRRLQEGPSADGRPPTAAEAAAMPERELVTGLSRFLRAHADNVEGIAHYLSDLEARGEDRTKRNLRILLGLPADSAEPDDVKRLLSEARLDGAYVAVQELPDDLTQTVSMLNEVALTLRVFGHLKAGEALFERAVRLNPDRPALLFNYARLRFEQQNYREAARLLRRVVMLAPDLEAAVDLLAESERRQARGTGWSRQEM